jgi:hypothetical protein
VLVATIATLLAPGAGGSFAYGVGLASFGHLGWVLALLAVAIHGARDPIAPAPEPSKPG